MSYKKSSKFQTKNHRLPEDDRQEVMLSFRLTHNNTAKLQDLMAAAGTTNLRVFIEKVVLKLKKDSVVARVERSHQSTLSKEFLQQFRGVANNLNQLLTILNTLKKKALLSSVNCQELAGRAKRIMDSLSVYLTEKES